MSSSTAQQKYDKANTTSVHLKFNNKYDKDILDKLKTEQSKTGYIKSLIRADIAKSQNQT